MNRKSFRILACILMGGFLLIPLQGCSSKYTVPPSVRYAPFEGELNQHSRVIRTDREHVFRILTDVEIFKNLCPKGTVVTFVTPKPYRAGTLVNTKIEHIFRLEWNTRVEEVVPGEKIRLRFLDGFFAGGTEIWEFEVLDKGTRVTQTIIVRPRGMLRKIAWSLKVRNRHDVMVEKFLDRLKQVAEMPPGTVSFMFEIPSCSCGKKNKRFS